VRENNFYNDELYLNIANFQIGTKALGPGYRAAIWVQGCPFHCSNCFSPQWIPNKIADLIKVNKIAAMILAIPEIDGITISGGEPLLQSKQLIELIKILRIHRNNLNVIVYTGFQRKKIETLHPDDPKKNLLNNIDVLIDGIYIDSLNDNQGLRGSSNQIVWHLTDRLISYNFSTTRRTSEIIIRNGVMNFIGVPERKISKLPEKLVSNYVRA
jgi:anaerobic ribonucleoside-triphosphate reductase activating protein